MNQTEDSSSTRSDLANHWSLIILAVLVLAFVVFFSYSAVVTHHRLTAWFFDLIPPDASVSTQQCLNPHLTRRRQISILPHDRGGDYQLLVGFYNPADGQRLSLADNTGDFFAIPLRITP